MSFERWLGKIDSILIPRIGIGYLSLRDRNWRYAYDDGMTPAEAVEELVGSLDDENIENTFSDELFG